MILVDTNVLLDVFEGDAEWSDWSQDRLDSVCVTDTLAINPVIYSELSIGFARIEELEAVIEEASLAIEYIPREALFLAGKAFLRYRRGRGVHSGPARRSHGAHGTSDRDEVVEMRAALILNSSVHET